MDETVNRSQPATTSPGDDFGRPRRPKRFPWVGFLLLVVLLVAAYFVYQRVHNGPSQSRRGNAQPPQAVRTAAAVTGNMPISLNALGTVTSLDTVSVQTQVSGKLTDVGFTEGQLVKVGDFLAQIDPRPYQALLEQAQATLAKDTAALAQAQGDLVRYQTLIRQDSISKQQVQDQQFLVQQDQAAIKVDQANIDTAQLSVSFARITSPISGLAGLRQVDVGNYLQPTSSTPIVTLTQIEPISVVFSVPAQALPQVRARMKVTQLPVAALDQTDSHTLETGALAATDSQISTATGTINLRATFANSDDVLFPNQFVNVKILVDTETGVTLIPNPAIQRGAPGTFVYLAKPDNTVSVQVVKIGPSDANNTVVVSGLSTGQSVVIDGADRLSQGAPIIVRNGAPVLGTGGGKASGGSATAGAASGGKPGSGQGRRSRRNGAASGGAPASTTNQPSQAPQTGGSQ